MTRTFDYIVIGQGIAGTTLAWQLRRRGLRVLVIDREAHDGASQIAAGLITPVTGKRLAKSWRWDELYPAALAFYRLLEAETGAAFFHERPSLRLFAEEAEHDECHRRTDGIIAGWVCHTPHIPDCFVAPSGGFEMLCAARLDVPRYLEVSRERFCKDDGYLAANIELAKDVELFPTACGIAKLNVQARGLVVCRGFTPGFDPWFGSIRFNAAKGEILTLRIPGLSEDRVIHRGIWLAPAGGDIYHCGSTYKWDDLNCVPTADGRAEIEARLRAFLRLPSEVIDHRAAVRPVIDAGYPVFGRHPAWPQLAYFNGLGSKGSLLAPFFAEQLAACLVGECDPELAFDVRRFLAK